jgi:hypothetical protein
MREFNWPISGGIGPDKLPLPVICEKEKSQRIVRKERGEWIQLNDYRRVELSYLNTDI